MTDENPVAVYVEEISRGVRREFRLLTDRIEVQTRSASVTGNRDEVFPLHAIFPHPTTGEYWHGHDPWATRGRAVLGFVLVVLSVTLNSMLLMFAGITFFILGIIKCRRWRLHFAEFKNLQQTPMFHVYSLDEGYELLSAFENQVVNLVLNAQLKEPQS